MSKQLVLITGASQGYGRSVAVQVAKQCDGPTYFVLVARNAAKLEDTRTLILAERSDAEVTCVVADLSDVSEIDAKVLKAANAQGVATYDRAILINNAGSLGRCNQTVSEHSTDTSYVSDYVQLNVTSCVCLTSGFVRTFKPAATKVFVVNVTSLFGIQATGHYGLYGMSRAAREMYHNVLAKEEGDDSNVRVLNWSPGVMKTAMNKEIMEDCGNKEIVGALKGMDAKGMVVDPMTSAERMVQIVVQDTFDQGARFDYYDVAQT